MTVAVDRPWDRLIARIVTLWCVACALRALLWIIAWPPTRTAIRNAIAFARQDTAVIVGFGVVAAVLLIASRPTPRLRRPTVVVMATGYWIVGLSLAITVAAVQTIGTPIRLSLLANADWFRSYTPVAALRSAATPGNLMLVGGSIVVLAVLPMLLTRLVATIRRRRGGSIALAATGVALLAWYAMQPPVVYPTRSVARTQNGLLVLARSIVQGPALDVMAAPVLPRVNAPMVAAVPHGAATPPRTVVLVVLESIGADAAYGESRVKAGGLMPTLDALARHGLRFENVYTPISASKAAGIHLLSGRFVGYPASFDDATATRDTLAARLRARGWHTGMFMSGDLAFQQFGDYLAPRGFEHLQDRTATGCTTAEIDDRCTAAAFDRWLGGLGQAPAFAVLWTGQAHYPYYTAATPGAQPLARYQQAVRGSDAAIAAVVEALRRRNRLDDALIVVVGDHGEAFDEHGFQLHANSAYREETRVPLVLVAPGLPRGLRLARSGSTLDIGSTILALLPGTQPLGRGRDLLAAGAMHPAFSYALGAAPTLAYRIGASSTVLSLENGAVDRFDLDRDPDEQHPRHLTGTERAQALAVFSTLAHAARADGGAAG